MTKHMHPYIFESPYWIVQICSFGERRSFREDGCCKRTAFLFSQILACCMIDVLFDPIKTSMAASICFICFNI